MSAQVEQYDYEAISTRSTGHGFQGFSTWYQVLKCDNRLHATDWRVSGIMRSSRSQKVFETPWRGNCYRKGRCVPRMTNSHSLSFCGHRFILNPQLIFFFSSSRVVVFSLRSEGGLTKRAAGMCSSRSSQAWLFAWGLFSFGRAGLMNWRKSEQKSSQSQADNLEQGGGGSFFLVFVGHQPCTPRMFLLRRWLPRSERRLRCHLCDSSVWLATQRGRDRQCLWYSLIALM